MKNSWKWHKFSIFQNLTKTYAEKKVFENLNLSFEKGEITCILGSSGIGKTTLFRIMMGLEVYDFGKISGVPESKSALFQEDRLIEGLSPIKNIEIVLNDSNKRKEIIENLKFLNLNENLDNPVSGFSGGMKRRVSLVRAMMKDSEIFFLDEPFTGVDSNNSEKMLEYIKYLKKNRTILIILHDEKIAKKLSDKFIFLENL